MSNIGLTSIVEHATSFPAAERGVHFEEASSEIVDEVFPAWLDSSFNQLEVAYFRPTS